MNMNVNFKARACFHKEVSTIKKLPSEESNLYLAEMFPQKNRDFSIIKLLGKKWNNDSEYIKYIADGANYKRYGKVNDGFPILRFFALTKQQRNFENPIPCDIVAIAQVTSENTELKNIDFVASNPMYATNLPFSKFKDSTEKLMEFILDYFKFKTVSVHALKTEFDFFENLGLKQTGKWTYSDKIQLLERKPTATPEA